jgi:N-methylhydantoinase A
VTFRIGIDVGGTFTDFVLLDSLSGRLDYHKQPSTPHDPAEAIGKGAAALIAKTGIDPARIELVSHGTTIPLNAVLQRNGARLGVVVSVGNRDILEIARLKMADAFDFFAQPEKPLATREQVVEISARLDANGRVVMAPTGADFDRVAKQLRELDVEAVAVVLLNAYANVSFEISIAHELAGRLQVPVSASADIWAEIGEYERAMIAVMNTYVAPIMRRYYGRLEANFRAQSINAPVSITTSNGGSLDIATAYDRPIDSILSGPASGVVAAIDAGRRANIRRIVTFDMGGTSADIAVAVGDQPEITTRSALGELPLILPAVNVSAIGAGGGSIIRVDSSGFLKVGPSSAGAVPGPACFGKGGTEATITDCYLVCGFLDPERFGDGLLRLSTLQAVLALQKIGNALGYMGSDIAKQAADAALRIASSMMATEVRKMLARSGADPADFTLLPFGGAGPTHAALLAAEAGIHRILIPPRPGIFCALGAAVANLRRDFVASCRLSIGVCDHADRTVFERTLARLEETAASWAATVGGRAQHWHRQISAEVRYPDQAFDLTITLADVAPDCDTDSLVDRLAAAFHADHMRLYGFNEPESRIEINRIALSAIGVASSITFRTEPAKRKVERSRRALFINGRRYEARIIGRDGILQGESFDGPTVIEQTDTTVLIPPGWRGERLACGSILMTRIESDEKP